MSTVKDIMIKVIRDQPEDSDFDEILRELAFVKDVLTLIVVASLVMLWMVLFDPRCSP